jgi:hypothetical protein
MTTQDIKELIARIDPEASHYECATDGRNFTVWMEYERITLYADDDGVEHGWHFEVDRYTKDEYDPIVERIEQALMACENVTLKPRTVQYDQMTGYIRHIFDCEAV